MIIIFICSGRRNRTFFFLVRREVIQQQLSANAVQYTNPLILGATQNPYTQKIETLLHFLKAKYRTFIFLKKRLILQFYLSTHTYIWISLGFILASMFVKNAESVMECTLLPLYFLGSDRCQSFFIIIHVHEKELYKYYLLMMIEHLQINSSFHDIYRSIQPLHKVLIRYKNSHHPLLESVDNIYRVLELKEQIFHF